MNFKEKVNQLVKNSLKEYPKLFLISLSVSVDNKIKVILDGESGVSINDCVLISRNIENNLDVEDKNFGQIIDEMMSELVEPKLVEPTFVIDYPKAISPLAKKHRNNNPALVERFELFIGGMEIANAFTELNDPIDQRDRFMAQEKLKDKGDEEAQVLDEEFLEAMEIGMPPTAGVGIGIDRLVMILCGLSSIKDVILFPAMRSKRD